MSEQVRSIREMSAQKSLELVLYKRQVALNQLWDDYHSGRVSWNQAQREANEQGLNLWA